MVVGLYFSTQSQGVCRVEKENILLLLCFSASCRMPP